MPLSDGDLVLLARSKGLGVQADRLDDSLRNERVLTVDLGDASEETGAARVGLLADLEHLLAVERTFMSGRESDEPSDPNARLRHGPSGPTPSPPFTHATTNGTILAWDPQTRSYLPIEEL